MRIGIMQGRLVPPIGNRIQAFPTGEWETEFGRAREAGLATIEWIYEVFAAEENPLSTDAGIAQMRAQSQRYGLEVRSLCADFFMDRPLLRATESEMTDRVDVLRWILARCAAAEIERVVLPFVDASGITTAAEAKLVTEILMTILPAAESHGIEVHLESSLPPAEFAKLLTEVPHPLVRVNYDSGNSASLGYDPAEEMAAYGGRIGSVHIKDRVRGGGTVPLGTGDTDFTAVIRGLRAVGYERDYILQVARGPVGFELEWARRNREFLEGLLK